MKNFYYFSFFLCSLLTKDFLIVYKIEISEMFQP